MGVESGDREEGTPDDGSVPAFLSYGIFTVLVFGVAVTALVQLSSVDVQGATLIAFTVGFSVFMAVYFGSMWIG
jgi:hypothetical protein